MSVSHSYKQTASYFNKTHIRKSHSEQTTQTQTINQFKTWRLASKNECL